MEDFQMIIKRIMAMLLIITMAVTQVPNLATATAESEDPAGSVTGHINQEGNPSEDDQLEVTSTLTDMSAIILSHSNHMKRISSAPDYTLAVMTDGRVLAWGDNSYGQCNVPYALVDVVQVSAGSYHSLALKSDGTVVAWGSNEYGQCGVPADLSNVSAVSAGGAHSLALKTDGPVVAWGNNNLGQCNVPADLSEVVAVSAGGYHSLVLKADGTVTAWGYAEWNQLDIPPELMNPETAGIVAIAAPWGHNLAIRKDGTVFSWGYDIYGQATIPNDLDHVVAVSGSYSQSVALKVDGSVVTWGYNNPGPLLPPPEATGAIAIACQQEGIVALIPDQTLISWGSTNVPTGTSLVAKPRIIGSNLGHLNRYMDIYMSTGVYTGSMQPVPPEAFVLTFANNGGDATDAIVTSVAKQDGTPLTGGETVIRVGLSVTGNPTGVETVEILIPETIEVCDAAGTLMALGRTTGFVKFLPTSVKPIATYMSTDNTYIDVVFNTPIYGDMNRLTPVSLEDFQITFSKNNGTATVIQGTSLVDPGTGANLLGGERKIRFCIEIQGVVSGDETLIIGSISDESIYSSDGFPWLLSNTTDTICLNPAEIQLTSIYLAEDNSYIDLFFNTGVYGGWDYDGDWSFGSGPVDEQRIRLFYERNEGNVEDVRVLSLKKNDNTVESLAGELTGGEKVVRMFLASGQGYPTGVETVSIFVEGVFDRNGQVYASYDPEHETPLHVLPIFTTFGVGPNNTYVDVNFNLGVFGASDGSAPVDPNDFSICFYQNDGQLVAVSIRSVKCADNEIESLATPLSGGETTLRFFLELSGPLVGSPTGGGNNESVEIRPKAQSVFSQSGKVMSESASTEVIRLKQNFPKLVSAQLSSDNEYIDIHFDFGVYGDANHTSPVTKEHFALAFIQNGGTATNVEISSITNIQGNSLVGGESSIRLFLSITGAPNGVEEVFVRSAFENPLYNVVGNPINYYSEKTQNFNLSGYPSVTNTTWAADLSFVDLHMSLPVFGDQAGSTPVDVNDFNVVIANNTNEVDVVILDIRKNDSTRQETATPLTGGETVLRFFIKITGDLVGNEVIRLQVAGGTCIYSAAGKPMPEGSISGLITVSVPKPLISSVQLAANNKYIDIYFNTGVYGDGSHLNPINREDFILNHIQNDGNASIVDLADVRKPDAETLEQASLLTGGEKVIRIFLNIPKPASGEETIEIKVAGADAVFSYTGLSMDATDTTGVLHLNVASGIIGATMADDNSYVDIVFNAKIYGASDLQSPAAYDDFDLSFNTETGGLTSAQIIAAKKPDGTPLEGGETVIRVFLNMGGSITKHDYINIGPKSASSLYDQNGTALSVEGSGGNIFFHEVPLTV
ncbi:MAG TPA: hypothetical protein DDZ89_08875, partial [Clostridiales bacterium]|nr:hypothetical protein [Clostridiales bacterium]